MAVSDSEAAPTTDEQMVESSRAPSFTAVNGVNGRASPKVSENSAPNGQAGQSPTDTISKTNGIYQTKSLSDSQTPSPSLSGSQAQALNDTPASQHSPPTRKRSYPEAFGDSGEQSYRARAPDSQQNGDGHRQVEYPRNHHERRDSMPDHERQRSSVSDYDSHAPGPRGYYSRQPASDDQEQQLAESLQRENEDSNEGRRGSFASPDADEQRQHYGDYGASRSSGVQVDADRKRRKRVFSNRTKTGCMTCRKRKKKCDELHPECEFPPPLRRSCGREKSFTKHQTFHNHNGSCFILSLNCAELHQTYKRPC